MVTPAKKHELDERRARVLRLHIHGHSLRWIGRKLGVSYITIRRDVKAGLEELAEERKEMAELHVDSELRKIKIMEMELKGVIRAAREVGLDDKDARASIIQANNALDKISNTKSKLLGMDHLAKLALEQKDKHALMGVGGDAHDASDKAREAMTFLKETEANGFIPDPDDDADMPPEEENDDD